MNMHQQLKSSISWFGCMSRDGSRTQSCVISLHTPERARRRGPREVVNEVLCLCCREMETEQITPTAPRGNKDKKRDEVRR